MKLNKALGFAGLAFGVLVSASSCNKTYLDTKPSEQVVLDDVFTTTTGARSVVNGMHRILYSNASTTSHVKFGVPALNTMYDLMGEDFGMTDYNWFFAEANYSAARDADGPNWSIYYNVINNANFLLKYIDDADGPDGDKNELKAQAYAMRGWAYLQLIQCYQFAYNSASYVVASGGNTGTIQAGATLGQALGVPIYTTPGQTPSPRASLADNIDRIRMDLDSAVYFFGQPGVVARASDKSQININVAHGLRARFNLYTQNWTLAASEARLARTGYSLADSAQLYDGFNSVRANEWIWGSVINQEANGIYASFMSHMDPRVGGYAATCMKAIGRDLYRGVVANSPDAIDTFDYRIRWWLPQTNSARAYFFPVSQYPEFETWAPGAQLKFRSIDPKSFLSDYPMMRTAEMYLIEAEAMAMSGNSAGSISVLEEFMERRSPRFSSANLTTTDRLVQAIWRQRRVELWGEGFRYFDAKRQMARLPNGVTSLQSIDRSANGHWDQFVYQDNRTVQAGSATLNFRIPGSEVSQNPGCVQNP